MIIDLGESAEIVNKQKSYSMDASIGHAFERTEVSQLPNEDSDPKIDLRIVDK